MKILSYLPVAVATALLTCSSNLARADESGTTTNARPKIVIKTAPSISPGEGSTDDIEGTVTGVTGTDYKVVIYAYGDKWYVQPTVAAPLTDIDEEGKWETKTHGGLEYAALLVKPSFKPSATLEILPKVGGDVIAVAKKKPKKDD
jgi:hypothetical protein